MSSHDSSDLQFGEDDKWEVDPVYAERDRLRDLLAEVLTYGAGYVPSGLRNRIHAEFQADPDANL